MRIHFEDHSNTMKIIGMAIAVIMSIGMWFGIILAASSLIEIL